MSDIVIKADGVSKKYQLGTIGTGTLRNDLHRWWARYRGREDPYTLVDQDEPDDNLNGDFWALRDVSFEVKQGDTLGIIGKNGAGKSTLLKILSRVTTPTTGEIKVKGRIASLLEVGTGFHPELTGRENIFLNGAILGMSKVEIRYKLDEIIAFSGVEKYIDTPVKRYSSGMYVRLAFAVAAHLEPEILIVDEVLAVGDAEFQKKCIGKMSQVAREGRTILFVSHNMAAVKNLCKNGLFLKNGELFLSGTIDSLSKAYMNMIESNSKAEVKWSDLNNAPGNDDVRITGVRVLNKHFQLRDNLMINEDFFVEIDFYNEKSNNQLSSNVQLFNSIGVAILSSANWASAISNHDPYSGVGFSKGHFKSRIKIPANFLNEGTYLINAIILQNISAISAFAQEAVTFNVIDNGEMRKEYTGDWLGAVRPKLEWYTSSVAESHVVKH